MSETKRIKVACPKCRDQTPQRGYFRCTWCSGRGFVWKEITLPIDEEA